MDLNFLIFPAPNDSLNSIKYYENELIYIPKIKNEESTGCCNCVFKIDYIPCLLLTSLSREVSKNFLIFFHGNAEDIFIARDMMDYLRSSININIILVEYPGYSIYKEDKGTDKVLSDSLVVYDYILNTFKVENENIFVFGRSIGTAPAIYLSSKRKPAALITISPFTSIRDLVQHLAGSLFKYLVSDKLNNEDNIKDISCPILFIHGQKDALIPYLNTIKLMEMCNCPYDVILPVEMDHNNFDFENDLINPIKDFFKRHTCFRSDEYLVEVFPLNVYDVPPKIKEYLESIVNKSE